jgi:hypothetical protein
MIEKIRPISGEGCVFLAHDVFSSYSVQDKTVANAVCNKLEAKIKV